jgi:hypothetical protein
MQENIISYCIFLILGIIHIINLLARFIKAIIVVIDSLYLPCILLDHATSFTPSRFKLLSPLTFYITFDHYLIQNSNSNI